MKCIQNEKKFSCFSSQTSRDGRILKNRKDRSRNTREGIGGRTVDRNTRMMVRTTREKGVGNKTVARRQGRRGEGGGDEVSSLSGNIGEFIGSKEGKGSRKEGEDKGGRRGSGGGGKFDTEVREDTGGPLGLLVGLGVREREEGEAKGVEFTTFDFSDDAGGFNEGVGGTEGDFSSTNYSWLTWLFVVGSSSSSLIVLLLLLRKGGFPSSVHRGKTKSFLPVLRMRHGMDFDCSEVFMFEIFREGKEGDNARGNAKGRGGGGVEVGEFFEVGEVTEDVLVDRHFFGKITSDVISNQSFNEGKMVAGGEREGREDIIRGDDGAEEVGDVVGRGGVGEAERREGKVFHSFMAHVAVFGSKNTNS